MPSLSTSSEASVYQLRVVLRAVSPLIWRRLLVRSDTTIADVHSTLQTTFGWTDEHLNAVLFTGAGAVAGVDDLGVTANRHTERHARRFHARESLYEASNDRTPTAAQPVLVLLASC